MIGRDTQHGERGQRGPPNLDVVRMLKSVANVGCGVAIEQDSGGAQRRNLNLLFQIAQQESDLRGAAEGREFSRWR